MKTAKFQYKCRLCGEVYKEGSTSEENAQYILISIAYNFDDPEPVIGVKPTMIGIHSGCKIGCGISDLIGYIVEN